MRPKVTEDSWPLTRGRSSGLINGTKHVSYRRKKVEQAEALGLRRDRATLRQASVQVRAAKPGQGT